MQARLNYRNASTNASQHRSAQHCLATLLLRVLTLKIEEVFKGIRQRSERLQNISFITFVYRVFETLCNNYKTMIMNWTLAYSLWEKVEVNFEHYTDNQQFTWWYNHKQKSQFFLVFYSSPYDVVMDVDCKIFVSNAVLYFSRSQAKMRILKLCLSLKRPFNNLHLRIARH